MSDVGEPSIPGSGASSLRSGTPFSAHGDCGEESDDDDAVSAASVDSEEVLQEKKKRAGTDKLLAAAAVKLGTVMVGVMLTVDDAIGY